MFRVLGFSHDDISRIAKDLMEIAARSLKISMLLVKILIGMQTNRLYILRLQKKPQNINSSFLSVKQIQRIQAQKAKALAILKKKKCLYEIKCDNLGHPAVVDPPHANLSIKDKACSVMWADMSGGKLTEVRIYEPDICVHPREQSATTAAVSRTLTWEQAQFISDSDLEEAQNF